MKRTHRNLILLFSLIFILLMGIQVYFLVKTYQIKENDFYKQLYADLENFDVYVSKKSKVDDDSLQKVFRLRSEGKISEKKLKALFAQNSLRIQPYLDHYVDSILPENTFQIALSKEFTSAISTPDNKSLIDSPVIVYQTKITPSNKAKTNTGTWATNVHSDNFQKNSFRMEAKTAYHYQILNISKMVFGDLWLLIASSFLLLGAIIWIFSHTIKNIIEQEKKIKILYNSTDTIAHEFKTPIATLKIASKSLRKNHDKAILPVIERQVERLENLMQQLHEPTNASDCHAVTPNDWQNFIEDLRIRFPNTIFDLQQRISKTLPFDKLQMETVLKNLIENSIKYGASQVNINLSASKNTLTLNIKDNGEGMENSELKNIFEKFYRISKNPTSYHPGLGLGLYFVKNIVNKYHGKIIVNSQLHEGSIFIIELPYED